MFWTCPPTLDGHEAEHIPDVDKLSDNELRKLPCIWLQKGHFKFNSANVCFYKMSQWMEEIWRADVWLGVI